MGWPNCAKARRRPCRWRAGSAKPSASIHLRQQRAALAQHVSYPDELPITAKKDEIVAALKAHPVVIVAGETGSGKTTQLPKMFLEAGLGARARIGCTQPRRVAALSIARRLAEEMHVGFGREVGCKIRFADQSRPQTSLKVMTDGILLAEIQGDPLLAEYEALIIDEAHERSLNIDFLLGYLKLLLQKRDDLKLIITSATIDTERFSRAFDGAPVIEVSGRMYPVELRYSPLDENAEDEGELTYVDAAVNAVDRILEEPLAGDILVFMPTERDIRETCDLLQAQHRDRLDVTPLFGRLTSGEQQRVFSPGPRRRVVVATNIAETSLTVPRIRYVVDTGLARISRYHPGTRSKRLPVEPISQSSANQRKGRCGRLADGVCIRLYSEADFDARQPYIEPEIQRCDLADVILRMKAFQLGEMETFPFIEPPSPSAVQGAYQLLQELGALDEQRELTRLGRDLARLPVDPAVGRMILEAQHERALPEALIIAAGLSVQDPRERPLDQRDAAEAAHRRFQHPQSDFLTLLNIWNAYHDKWESLKTQNQLRKFCKGHFLSFVRMREWVDVHGQLQDAVEELKCSERTSVPRETKPPQTHRGKRAGAEFDARYAAVHRSILTGLFGHVAQRENRNLYRLGGNKQAMVFPGSGLFEKTAGRGSEGKPASKLCASSAEPTPAQPKWLIAGELLETSRLFIRIVAAITPDWVIELAPHLIKIAHEHPHWDREAGRVLCTERITLRGLVLREGPTGYLKVNAADATEIFIRSALIEEDLDGRHAFLEHNRRLRRKIEMWQTRMRHHASVDLDEALFAFYAARVQNVASIHDLNRLLKGQAQSDFLCATEADLLGEQAASFDAGTFPDAVQVGRHSVPVNYAYAPAQEDDGVTFRLTYALAEAIDPATLDWVVPALREERVHHLLRLLPKTMRRPLMPLNVTARAIVEHVDPTSGSFLEAMSQFVRRQYGVLIPVSAWPVKDLPPHLQPRFEIVGNQDNSLAAGRNLNALLDRVEQGRQPNEAAALRRALARWERYGLTDWTFGELPERCLVSETGGVPLYLYPGLHVENGDVSLRLFRRLNEAETASRIGLRRLAELVLPKELAWLQKDLRGLTRFAPLYATLGDTDELIETAWTNLRRHVLAPPNPLPRTADAFTEYLERIRQQARGLGSRFMDWVGAILEKRQEALVCRRPLPNMQQEIDALVPGRFLEKIPFEQLAHVPRYLQALFIRAERAALNPAKDAEKVRRVQPYSVVARQVFAQPARSPEAFRRMQQFRWLLEEFKVSVFAQELGTAQPVSTKRLDEALRELREAQKVQT